MQMNRVVIAGYVSKKPETRHLPSGTPVASVRVGESVRYAEGSGETRELTNWHSLSFYGKLADVAQALKKGETYTSMAGSSNDSSSCATAASRGRCTRL